MGRGSSGVFQSSSPRSWPRARHRAQHAERESQHEPWGAAGYPAPLALAGSAAAGWVRGKRSGSGPVGCSGVPGQGGGSGWTLRSQRLGECASAPCSTACGTEPSPRGYGGVTAHKRTETRVEDGGSLSGCQRGQGLFPGSSGPRVSFYSRGEICSHSQEYEQLTTGTEDTERGGAGTVAHGSRQSAWFKVPGSRAGSSASGPTSCKCP